MVAAEGGLGGGVRAGMGRWAGVDRNGVNATEAQEDAVPKNQANLTKPRAQLRWKVCERGLDP